MHKIIVMIKKSTLKKKKEARKKRADVKQVACGGQCREFRPGFATRASNARIIRDARSRDPRTGSARAILIDQHLSVSRGKRTRI